MATVNYLQLVADMIMETGLNSGSVPSSIAEASGDAAKVAYWIRVADLQVQRERIDWGFLWVFTDPLPLVEGSNTIALPVYSSAVLPAYSSVAVNKIIRDSLAIIDSNGEAYFPQFRPWREFSNLYLYTTQESSDHPEYWSIAPDKGEVRLSAPIGSSGLTQRFQYYRTPQKLRESADISLIPDDFERIIIALAKVLYAEHEDAPEVSAGAHEEYDSMFGQMLAAHAPDSEWSRMDDHPPLVVENE